MKPSVNVSRFVAEAIAELSCDDNIINANDEAIEVDIAPCEINFEVVLAYVTHRCGNEVDAKMEVERSFNTTGMSSTAVTTFFWYYD